MAAALTEFVCSHCGNRFEADLDEYVWFVGQHTYCSETCAWSATQRRKRG